MICGGGDAVWNRFSILPGCGWNTPPALAIADHCLPLVQLMGTEVLLNGRKQGPGGPCRQMGLVDVCDSPRRTGCPVDTAQDGGHVLPSTYREQRGEGHKGAAGRS